MSRAEGSLAGLGMVEARYLSFTTSFEDELVAVAFVDEDAGVDVALGSRGGRS